MPGYRLSEAAETDIIDILVWSETQFGEAARRRYQWLIVTGLMDIATDPARPGSIARPELGDGVRSWHLRNSRDRARGAEGVMQRPRHFVIYRDIDARIVIGRILHDAMELERHLRGAWDVADRLP
jgi:toxin ParE1/3/4